MAGHSQFKNIMHRKGAQDAKRAKVFTKLGKEIMVAVKTSGPDPASNPRLRAAIIEARKNSMPRDNVERAIKRATGADAGGDFEEIRYEGMGPGNVALIVETLTDNRNRTASNVRTAFGKMGGAMTPVAFNFERVGLVSYKLAVASSDAIMEAAIEAGANDVETGEETHDIYTAPDDFISVRMALESHFGEPETARLDWRPSIKAAIDDEDTARNLFKLIDALEDDDDVQRIAANYDIADALLDRLG